MEKAFIADFMQQFTNYSNLDGVAVNKLLSLKLRSGGSDRASKMLKFGKLLANRVGNNYIHYACDNHQTETAWEEVQSMSRVSSIEELVKQCYSLFKNSASCKLKLAAIAESFEEKTLRPRNIFSIKFLTSEESATEATLVDYRQLLKLTEQLKDDTSLSREQRSNIKSILSKLRDARSLVNLIALNDVLTEGISPYQK